MKKIIRNSRANGWYIPERLGTRRRKFLDAEYGSPEQSYMAAQSELETDETICRKIETEPRSNKTSELPVGITHYTVKDGKQLKHRFAVCNPLTGKPQMVHIGNANTYARNWEQKLAVAQGLRDQFVEQHKELHA